jgi:hypothetical protein
LEQGGLLVLWTPNGDSAKYEEYPTTFRVDLEHMQYLTADSCIFLATQLNMSVVHLESLGFPSLAGIDSPARHEHNLKTKMKKAIKLIPGYFVLNNLRVKMLASKKEDDRFGRYHLFCIMQKNE